MLLCLSFSAQALSFEAPTQNTFSYQIMHDKEKNHVI